jgi:hypothetical protein
MTRAASECWRQLTGLLVAAVAGACILQPACCRAEVKVIFERSPEGSRFQFDSVPAPSSNDAASHAVLKQVDGRRDPNSGRLEVLHDGRIPTDEDQPSQNFFFDAGTDGGRLQMDLESVIEVRQINTFSWHTDSRAPQVYRLYASEGTASGFIAEPPGEVDPTSCGWRLLTAVDSRSGQSIEGGQHGVSISDSAGTLGAIRFLLFDFAPTETADPFGNTFYSEIDVVDVKGSAPVAALSGDGPPVLKSFQDASGRYHFTIDATAAPDLMDWAETALRPVVQEWYPKLVAMLPSDGFTAATNLSLRFRSDMRGTPASAGGRRINLNSEWFRGELNREARGAVVHEMVHVVQSYGRGRGRRNDANLTRTPGWLVEGIADYIRWFLYEPETRGAEITARNLDRAKYDASYRITGNFLNWVTLKYDPEIVRKLNAAAREGSYREELWKDYTGKTVQELGDEWRREHAARLGE